MFKIKLGVVFVFYLFSGLAFAGVSNPAKVEELAINISRVYVKVAGYTPTGCVASDGWMVRSVTNVGVDQMLSLLVSAKLSGKNVVIRTQGCDGNYPIFDYVKIP